LNASIAQVIHGISLLSASPPNPSIITKNPASLTANDYQATSSTKTAGVPWFFVPGYLEGSLGSGTCRGLGLFRSWGCCDYWGSIASGSIPNALSRSRRILFSCWTATLVANSASALFVSSAAFLASASALSACIADFSVGVRYLTLFSSYQYSNSRFLAIQVFGSNGLSAFNKWRSCHLN
jgi:hypothetical protein